MSTPPALQNQYATRSDERAGGRRWRTVSKVLYQYYRRDMQDARDEQERMYPNNHDKHVQRTIPFVYRVARELASLYLKTPARRFLRKRDDGAGNYAAGDELPEATTDLVSRIYDGAQVTTALRHAQEVMIATGNQPILVWPMPEVGGIKLVMPPPHECDIATRDSLSTGELDVTHFWCRLPLQRDPITDLIIYGVAEITPTTAVWCDGPTEIKGRGLWNEAGTNPLGEVPLILLRRASPAPGEVWASAPEDLLDAQRAINHDMTDLGTIARLQGFAQGYVKGMSQEQVSDLEIGPNTFAGLWGEDAELGFASPTPDLRGYRDQMEAYMRTVTATNGLNPATLTKSQGVTALSKIIELADREVERRHFVTTFEAAEGRLYRLTAAWVNHLRALPNLLPPARVKLEFRESYMPADPLHEAQAMEKRIALGVSSPIVEIARLEGLTREEAQTEVETMMADTAAIGGGGKVLLNGAQITAAVLVAERVGLGQLDVDGGVALLVESLGTTEATARALLAGASPPTVEDAA